MVEESRPVHTDEYEIALARELAVCKDSIRDLVHALGGASGDVEAEVFLDQCRPGTSRDNTQDVARFEQRAALARWIERRKQYEDLLRLMKI
jgi:hypothetical protein